jgi:vacuolar protein sorting-associated protein 13A/C
MLIEQIVSAILVPYLEEYVANFDRKQIDIALMQGKVTLQNIQLKKYALDNISMDIPVAIAYGYLGSLVLNIPWHSLRSQAVTAEISDVYLILQPKKDIPYSEEDEKRRESDLKRRKLQKYEAGKLGTVYKKTEKKKDDDGFMDKLLVTIINNIHVTVKNVHIRYEDAVTCPEVCFQTCD